MKQNIKNNFELKFFNENHLYKNISNYYHLSKHGLKREKAIFCEHYKPK